MFHGGSGTSEHERYVARKLATLGYTVLAPDLFGEAFADRVHGMRVIGQLVAEPERLRLRMSAALACLRIRGVQHAFAIGHCFGGLAALELARSGAAIDGAVSFRGAPRALAMLIRSAVPLARVVVLNACYSDSQADELRAAVDCVVGMVGAVRDDHARSFAVGFYRALGNRRSVGNAMEHAAATLAAKQLPREYLPRVRTRDGVDANRVVLASAA